MDKTTVTHENGCITATNWMLDEVIDSFEKREMNDGSNDELIKELTIQKIEYGRYCLAEYYTSLGDNRYKLQKKWFMLDSELRERIIELGGTPNEIVFYEKDKK